MKKMMTKNNSKVIYWHFNLSRTKSFFGKGRIILRVIGSKIATYHGEEREFREVVNHKKLGCTTQHGFCT